MSVKSSPRTWLLLLLAVVLSGIIAWIEAGDRAAANPAARDGAAGASTDEAHAAGDAYTVDVELAE